MPRVDDALSAFANVVCASGSALLLLWCVPSSFVAKQAYLRIVSKSRLLATLNDRLLPVVVIAMLWGVAREWQRRRLAASGADSGRAVSGEDSGRAASGADRGRAVSAPPPVDSGRLHRSAFSVMLLLFMNRAFSMVRGDAGLLLGIDRAQEERAMLAFRPPPRVMLDAVTKVYRMLLSPVLVGAANLPLDAVKAGRPVLFVSNHPILGLDFPLLLSELYTKFGVYLRALADHSHFQIPGNAQIMRDVLGAVDGNPRNVDLLLGAGSPVLVYPGGARETFKKVGEERYTLHWGKKLGFARAAIKAGALIVPTASVGTEDMVEVMADLPLGWLPVPFLFGDDRTLPIVRPHSGLQRVYFGFGEPIDTEVFAGGWEDDAVCDAVRRQTHLAVSTGIEALKQVQASDPGRFASARTTRALRALFASSSAKATTKL